VGFYAERSSSERPRSLPRRTGGDAQAGKEPSLVLEQGRNAHMGAVSSTVQDTTQEALNSITQSSSAVCTANCTQIQSGNTIFLNGATTGNITFNQQCTVNATCQITNSIEAAATAVQKAIQSGSASPSWFIGLAQVNTDVQVTDQEVVNQITQSMDSTCNNGASQVQTANLIYVQNSTTGDIGFSQNTDLTSQCILSNLAKGTASSTQQADLYASAGGIGALLIVAIIVIVVVVVVIAAVVAANKKKKQDMAAQGGSSSASASKGSSSTGGLPISGGQIAGAEKGASRGAELGPEGAAAGAVLGAATSH
jgi:hypothetical protein